MLQNQLGGKKAIPKAKICANFIKCIYDIIGKGSRGCRTINDICQVLSIHNSAITKIKRGSLPTTEQVLKLFKEFGISPNYILCDQKPMYFDKKDPIFELEKRIRRLEKQKK